MNWKNEKAEFSLPSVMVGVIIAGLLTAIMFATVTLIIPWTQDHLAKNQAVEVQKAQAAFQSGVIGNNIAGAYATAPKTKEAGRYGSLQELYDAGFLNIKVDPDNPEASADGQLCTEVTSDGGFDVVSHSQTGNMFKGNAGGAVEQVEDITGTCYEALVDNNGPVGEETPEVPTETPSTGETAPPVVIPEPEPEVTPETPVTPEESAPPVVVPEFGITPDGNTVTSTRITVNNPFRACVVVTVNTTSETPVPWAFHVDQTQLPFRGNTIDNNGGGNIRFEAAGENRIKLSGQWGRTNASITQAENVELCMQRSGFYPIDSDTHELVSTPGNVSGGSWFASQTFTVTGVSTWNGRWTTTVDLKDLLAVSDRSSNPPILNRSSGFTLERIQGTIYKVTLTQAGDLALKNGESHTFAVQK